MLAVDLINRVSRILNDEEDGARRWGQSELLEWLNDGQREVVLHRPDASVKSVEFTCINNTRQTLPEEALSLVDVVRNTDGTPIFQMASLEWGCLDHGMESDRIDLFSFDERNPRAFYLHPIPDAGSVVELVYSVLPQEVVVTDFDGDASLLSISAIYANAVLDYMLFRALQKEDDAASSSRAAAHYEAFLTSLAGKRAADKEISSEPV